MNAGRRPVTALAATMAGTATTRERDKAREYVQWLEAQLATATARAETLEREIAALRASTDSVNVLRLFEERNAQAARAEAAEAELAGQRDGYGQLAAQVERLSAENAGLRAGIEEINRRGGWAEARIREALGDEGEGE
ncbi:MAG: hypothetical protein KAX65_07370 [Caldilineaceae bacterium]|nr:hypothetical protein [Caldilineaceae bacterium]